MSLKTFCPTHMVDEKVALCSGPHQEVGLFPHAPVYGSALLLALVTRM